MSAQRNQGIIQSGGTLSAQQLAVGLNASNVLHANSSDAATDQQGRLGSLLQELLDAIEKDPALPESQRQDALQQVQAIASAHQLSDSQQAQGMVKAASRILRGMFVELPSATQFIEACTKLLPLITKIFGF